MKHFVAVTVLLCLARPASAQEVVWERIGGINDGMENVAQPVENNYETFAVGAPGSGSQGTWQTHTNGTRLFPGPNSSQISADGFNQYDWVHLLSTGDVFRAGSAARSSRWTHADTSAPSAWLAPGSHTGSSSESFRIYGTAVLFPNLNSSYQDTVMVLGGETVFQQTVTNSVKFCKASATQSGNWPNGYTWTSVASLNHARTDACAVLLPTGGVLLLNGRANPDGAGLDPVKTPELFAGGVWTDQTACEFTFDHHHTAVLLPSGKILVGGGDNRDVDYAIFVPEYLTNGSPRPSWSSAPTSPMTLGSSTQYTANFTIATGATVERVVLMAPGANTHAIDMHQRYVQLQVVPSSTTSTSITFTAPTSSTHAPKGWYMMFLVSGAAVPSEARWVKLQ